MKFKKESLLSLHYLYIRKHLKEICSPSPPSHFHLNPSLTLQWNFPAGKSNFIFPQGSSGDNCLATSKFYYTKRYSPFVFHQTDFPALLCTSKCICFSISCLSAMLRRAPREGARSMKQSRALLAPGGTRTRWKVTEPRHENACVKILKPIWASDVISEFMVI